MNPRKIFICSSLFISITFSVTADDRLTRKQDEPNIVWGAATNSFRSGVYCENRRIVLNYPKMEMAQEAYLVLGNTSSNKMYYFAPKYGQSFGMEMTDVNGLVLPKTDKGKTTGQPLQLNPGTLARYWKKEGYHGGVLSPNENLILEKFNLVEYFRLDKQGTYKLKISQSILIADTNHFLKPLSLPLVTINVMVEKTMK